MSNLHIDYTQQVSEAGDSLYFSYNHNRGDAEGLNELIQKSIAPLENELEKVNLHEMVDWLKTPQKLLHQRTGERSAVKPGEVLSEAQISIMNDKNGVGLRQAHTGSNRRS